MAARAGTCKALMVAVHAEMLHEPDVWHVVRRVSARAARQELSFTIFVHPFWAATAAVDIAPRIHQLALLGHEIAQHTHYYDARTVSPNDKTTSMAESDVHRRLEEDFSALSAAGHEPQGFVSGAWMVPEALSAWLQARGFRYDCSRRSYVDRIDVPRPAADLIEVPTTATLRMALQRAFRRGIPSAQLPGGIDYILFYVHDHDLLDRRKRLAFWTSLLAYRRRGYRLLPGRQLVDLSLQRRRSTSA